MQWTCESNLTGFVHSYAAAAPYNTAENAKRSKPPPGARSGFVLWAVTDSCWWLCHCWAIHNFSFVATSKLNKSWGCTPFPQWVLWWCFPQVPFLFNYKPCISETFVCSSWNWPRHSKFTWWTARKADVLLKLHFAHIFLQNMAKMRCFFFFFGRCETASFQRGDAELLSELFNIPCSVSFLLGLWIWIASEREVKKKIIMFYWELWALEPSRALQQRWLAGCYKCCIWRRRSESFFKPTPSMRISYPHPGFLKSSISFALCFCELVSK